MTTTAIEVERKYDVAAEQALPDLSSVDGVVRVDTATYELDATYLDTEDLRLRAAATTLRRRSGGHDAGWHLKLPHGDDRLEVRLEGDTSEQVPAELQALVRSRTRTSPLLPVARLETSRTVHLLVGEGERVLAEVADDVVRARGAGEQREQRWREWEVELVDGPRPVLDAVQDVLFAAGARPSASSSKVGRVLAARSAAPGAAPWWRDRPVTSSKVTAGGVVLAHLAEQVEELVRQDPQVRRDVPDALHKMRVATRRLRSALTTFRPLLERGRTDPLREELKWLAAELGQVRDTEVMHERLRRLVQDEPAELVLGPVLEHVDTVMGERYRAAHDSVLVELEGERYLRLLDGLAALVADPPLLPAARERAAAVLPRLVAKAWRRLDDAVRAAGRVGGHEGDLLLHEARKDAKRARYAAEAVVGAYGAPAKAYAKAVTGVQEVLGEHQDSVVTREVLRELAQGLVGETGGAGFTLGRLHALEQARAERAGGTWRTAWDEAWRAASKKRLRRWLS